MIQLLPSLPDRLLLGTFLLFLLFSLNLFIYLVLFYNWYQDQVLSLRISCFYFSLFDWFHIVPKNFPQNPLSRSQGLSFSSGYVFLIRISIVGILVGWRLVISIGFYDHLWEIQIDFLLCFVWIFVLFDFCWVKDLL